MNKKTTSILVSSFLLLCLLSYSVSATTVQDNVTSSFVSSAGFGTLYQGMRFYVNSSSYDNCIATGFTQCILWNITIPSGTTTDNWQIWNTTSKTTLLASGSVGGATVIQPNFTLSRNGAYSITFNSTSAMTLKFTATSSVISGTNVNFNGSDDNGAIDNTNIRLVLNVVTGGNGTNAIYNFSLTNLSNYYNSSALTNFSIQMSNSTGYKYNFSTTTGRINTTIANTDISLWNITIYNVSSDTYINRTLYNYNVSSNLSYTVWQSELYLTATRKFSGTSVTATFTTPNGNTSTNFIPIDAGTFSISASATGFATKSKSFTTTFKSNTTDSITNMTNGVFTVNLTDLSSGQRIQNYTTTINTTFGVFESNTTTSSQVTFYLDKDILYNLSHANITNNGSYFNWTQNNVNVSTNYTASVVQSVITFGASELYTNAIISGGTFTSLFLTNSTQYLPQGTYSVVFAKAGWQSQAQSFIVTPLQIATLNVTNVTNTTLIVLAYNGSTGQVIQTFTTTVSYQSNNLVNTSSSNFTRHYLTSNLNYSVSVVNGTYSGTNTVIPTNSTTYLIVNLTSQAISNFTISMFNIYNSSKIFNFTVNASNGTTTYSISTLTGVATFPFNNSDISLWNLTIYSLSDQTGSFFNLSQNNVNVTNNYQNVSWQSELYLNATNKFANSLINGVNFTAPNGNWSTSLLRLPIGSFTIQANTSSYFNTTGSFTTTSLSNATGTITNLTNGTIFISPTSNNSLSSYNITISYGGVSETKSTVSGVANFTLTTGLNYTVNVTRINYTSYISTVVPTNITTYMTPTATTVQVAQLGVYSGSIFYTNTTALIGEINRTLTFSLGNITVGTDINSQLNYTLLIYNYTGSVLLYNVSGKISGNPTLSANFSLNNYQIYPYNVTLIDGVQNITQNYTGQLQVVDLSPNITAIAPWVTSQTQVCAVNQPCAIQIYVSDDGCALGGYSGNVSVVGTTNSSLLSSQNWTYQGELSKDVCMFLSSSFTPLSVDVAYVNAFYRDAKLTTVNQSGGLQIVATPSGSSSGVPSIYYSVPINNTVNLVNETYLSDNTTQESYLQASKQFLVNLKFNPIILIIFLVVLCTFTIIIFQK